MPADTTMPFCAVLIGEDGHALINIVAPTMDELQERLAVAQDSLADAAAGDPAATRTLS